jgi:hypothetical protein
MTPSETIESQATRSQAAVMTAQTEPSFPRLRAIPGTMNNWENDATGRPMAIAQNASVRASPVTSHPRRVLGIGKMGAT